MYSASQHSQANGALMRSAPIGIAAHGDPGKAARWARQHSMLTHPHPVCQEANAAFTAAIAVAIAGASRSEMIETALGVLGHDETSGLIGKTIQTAARGERPEDYQEQMGWVLIALQNAFYHLAAGHDVERSVIETILQGGDTDTNACITGALIGAVEGIQNVPPAWSLAVQSARASKGERARPTDYWPDDAVWLAQGLLV